MQPAVHEHMGSFVGHVAPGAAFVVWGLWTLWRHRAGVEPRDPLGTPFGAWLMLVVGVAGAVGELWFASWRFVDSSVINYQHATMYLGFSLAGALTLAHRRGRVARGIPSVAVAAAFSVTGLLFLFHGSHGPVSGQVHRLLSFLLFGGGAVALAEARRPARSLTLARAVVTLATGSWLIVIAWMLYRAGYDLSAPAVVMRASLFFVWAVLGSGLVAWILGTLRPARASGEPG